jgi:F0F1-type ATP synthase assembly protein I
MNDNKKNRKMMAMGIAYGVELVVVIMMGLFAGRWIGEQCGASEWGAILGCFVGFAGWTYRMARTMKTP